MKQLNIGVIGAGIGAAHLAGYAAVPGVRLLALAGLDDARVQTIAAKYGVERTFHEYTDLLAVPELDAVSICLPNALHLPVTLAALAAGKHVLVEKPLARTTAEAQSIVDAAAQHDKVLMVSFDKRFRNDVQWLKRYIDQGSLGDIYYAKAHWMRRQGIPRLGSWFVSQEQAGGGPLIDLGVHVLDIAVYLMNEPRPLSVTGATYAAFGPRGLKGSPTTQFNNERLPFEVEDLATAFIRLADGATLLLEASWATHSAASDDFGVTLYGTEGGAELLIRDYTYVNTVRVFSDLNGVPVTITPVIPPGGGHAAITQRFVDAIRGDGDATPTAHEGLQRTAVLEACYRSAAAGHEIVLESHQP